MSSDTNQGADSPAPTPASAGAEKRETTTTTGYSETPQTATLTVRLTEEYRQRRIQAGYDVPRQIEVRVSLPDLTQEERDAVRELAAYVGSYYHATRLTASSPTPTLAELIAQLPALRAEDAEEKARRDREAEEYRAHDAEREALVKASSAQFHAEKEAKEAARAKDRANWIAAHGSPGLQERVRRGYDCERRYVQERLASELPGWIAEQWDGLPEVDEDRTRSDPSDAALAAEDAAKAAGYEARTLWVKRKPAEEGPESEEEPIEREEVVIPDYHGHRVYWTAP